MVKGLTFGELRRATWLPGSVVPALVDAVRDMRRESLGAVVCQGATLRGQTPCGVQVVDAITPASGGESRTTYLRSAATEIEPMQLMPMEILVALSQAGRLNGFVEFEN
jgi:hypothetical protein